MDRGCFRVISEQGGPTKGCHVYLDEFEVYVPKYTIKRIVKVTDIYLMLPSRSDCVELYNKIHAQITECFCEKRDILGCLAKNKVVVYRVYTSKSKNHIIHHSERENVENYLKGNN